jgi:Helix-turn-helix domain
MGYNFNLIRKSTTAPQSKDFSSAINIKTRSPWVLAHMGRLATTQNNTIIDDLRARKTMLTTSEVMELLRITRATLCGWCRGGRVPHMRMPNNSYLFDPVRIATWMSDRAA